VHTLNPVFPSSYKLCTSDLKYGVYMTRTGDFNYIVPIENWDCIVYCLKWANNVSSRWDDNAYHSSCQCVEQSNLLPTCLLVCESPHYTMYLSTNMIIFSVSVLAGILNLKEYEPLSISSQTTCSLGCLSVMHPHCLRSKGDESVSYTALS
jgi:hypothetical protein